ncbi:MAG TPA: HEAT repeat domain-containing protein, partial [Blastocatellia bacterium]|nr:HEAT repeat domain-containing protein [Blastocatellia bacterium]
MKRLSLVLILIASAAGCGVSLLGYTDELFAEAAVYEHALPAAMEQTAAQNRAFINVEGADLRTRLDAALKQGRSRSPRTRFWTAYAFDVRPGLGIDVVIIHGNGSQTVLSGVTSGASNRYETRNVGVFLLHESDGSAVVRAELYNLERPREYSGYPVFWLGRGGNEESLGLLRKLIDSATDRKVAENRTDAIGAHDDPRVEAMLKELVKGSSMVEVRETAVSWLAHFPGNIDFLSDLVRNEREHRRVREEAVEAIGHSGDAGAMAALQGLFTSLSDRDLRKEIVEAAAHNEDQEASVSFLIKVAENEPEGEVRRQAIESMGHKSDRRSFQSLEKIAADSKSDAHSQREAVEAIGQREKDQAVPALTRIAKSHPRMEVRREALEALSHMPGQTSFLEEIALSEREAPELRAEAIRALGDSPSPDSIRTLEKLYNSIADRRLKQEVINAIEDCSDKAAAVELLIKIARTEQDRETRARAVSTLGDMDEDRAADSLFDLYNAERDEEMKEEVLEALGESSSKRSLQKLID